MGVERDSTRAWETIQASEKKGLWWEEPCKLFPFALDALDEGVMVIDAKGIIRIFNRAAAQLMGCPPEEALGRLCQEVCASSLCVRCPVFRLLQGEEVPSKDFHAILSHPQGYRLVWVHTILLHSPEGEVLGAMEIMRDVTRLQEAESQLEERHRFMGLVGRSRAMQEIYHLIELAAASTAPVLIQGEVGTGKELIAEAIHYASPRASRPLVKVDCSSLSEALLEVELFGDGQSPLSDLGETGMGRFQLADGGTLFLDGVEHLSPHLQARLLRALERREVERKGGVRTLKVDVRLIAATCSNLEEWVQQGRFRADLYYRLNVIPIRVPPLRERPEDILLLVEHFLNQQREKTGRAIQGIDEAAMRLLMEHSWPGNVRELQNALEYAFVVCQGDWIRPEHLPPALRQPLQLEPSLPERERILRALEQHHWRIRKAAQALGIDRTTLWRKMKRYGIRREF